MDHGLTTCYGPGMCMVDDADGWEFYSERHGMARKQHTCDECRRTIYIGEVYRAAVGKYDGEMQRFATCVHCLIAGEWLVRACSGYLFNAMLEDLREHMECSPAYASPVLQSLIDGMSGGWDDGLATLPDIDLVRASVPAPA